MDRPAWRLLSCFIASLTSHLRYQYTAFFCKKQVAERRKSALPSQDGRALRSMFYKGLLAVAARSQSRHVLLDLLLTQRVEEDQRQNDAHKADDGGNAGHVEDAAGDSGIKRSRFGVADDPSRAPTRPEEKA